jgi:CRISPR/Cas system-associated exonuclease Cas4 (RecB family)
MDEWRDALKRGVTFFDEETNLILRGGVDDIWINKKGELIVVDYKATSKDEEITLDDEWKIQYKRQMEIYQWLLKQNGYSVSDVGYFVYANAKPDRPDFSARLDFDIKIIPYTGKTDWIKNTLVQMKMCLESDVFPASNSDCDYCRYRQAAGEILQKIAGVKIVKNSKK